LPGENFSFCSEHESQRSIRLVDFSAQQADAENYSWRRLGIGGEEQREKEDEPKKRKERDLKELADDDENIHTIEIQRPLVQAISTLRKWAEDKKITVEPHLDQTVEAYLMSTRKICVTQKDKDTLPKTKKYTDSVVTEFWKGSVHTISTLKLQKQKKDSEVPLESKFEFVPTQIQKDCIDHLRRVYSIDDKESVLGITFPQLSSWVWHRVLSTQEKDRKDELVNRFVEEMAESKGLCLQGNLTRLVNVFSGFDAEVSLQDVDLFDTGPISLSYMQQQVAAAVTRFSKKVISYDELLNTVKILMKRANASKEVEEDWMNAINDLVL
jgi:hypothetical protein